MNLHFVMVRPARGENVGFSARALKTMGFQGLRIVDSKAQHSAGARKTAYASHDILFGAKHYRKLEEALADLDLVIGTTSKERAKRFDNHSPMALREILESKKHHLWQVGLVFGSEESGLTNEELECCHLISTIPMNTDYPSLNLAQSVLIYAWELSIHSATKKPRSKPKPASLQKVFISEVTGLLDDLAMDRRPLLSRRIMDRLMCLNSNDTQLMLGMIKKIRSELSKGHSSKDP